MKVYYYKEGYQICCPYCGSIQVKAMANQPKKYPFPQTSQNFHSIESLEQLQHVWRNGYDCKKCGNEFVALPKPPSNDVSGKLIKWVLVIIGIIIILSWLGSKISSNSSSEIPATNSGDTSTTSNTSTNEPDNIEQIINKKEQEIDSTQRINAPSVEELNEAFPIDAEQAAHGDYPKSIN